MVEVASIVRRGVYRGGLPPRTFVALLLTALGLSACGADTSLLGTGGPLGEPRTLQQAGTKAISRMVSYRPAVGPPDDVGSELSRHLNDAAVEQGVALVVDPILKLDLPLPGS